MADKRRSVGELVAMGVIAGLVAYGLAFAMRPRGANKPVARLATVLETPRASFELHPGAGRVTMRSRDSAFSRDVDLGLVVDGTLFPLALAREDLRSSPGSLRATVPVPVDDGTVETQIELHADVAHDGLAIEVTGPRHGALEGHHVAVRAELSSEGQVVFVPGVGPIADRATVSGSSLFVDAQPHPMAVVSTEGPLAIDALPEEEAVPVPPIHLSITTPPPRDGGDDLLLADLHLVVAMSSMVVWRTLAEIEGHPTALVRGHVTGGGGRTLVLGRDAQGSPQVRALAGDGGAFALDVPISVVQWYAALDAAQTSGLVTFAPGTPRDLVLDVSPGGDLHATIVDADGRAPLTARLVVRGVDGAADPSFGPDYRASGSGPVIDALRGDVTTPLPSGRYRVAATKGIEWSIDAKIVEISPGRVTDVELAPRHVLPTPGVLGCDLHVHARPSFDTPVTPEDRVLSLAAAGIDFAVPTEHNVVGDYSSALDILGLGGELLSVTGVEVTTYSVGFGHFGVFPYPPGAKVPPHRHTNMAAIFRVVRSGDPNRYFQLNHPRLPKGIGYFNNIGFDPRLPRSQLTKRVDFDGIEVYNGYDTEKPERVDQVLRDYWALLDYGWRYTATGSSDSHRIQFHWAGYPRTMVTVDPKAAAGEDDAKVDPLVVVLNIKKGHATVTSGPVIELTLAGTAPGDELVTSDDPIHGHVRIRAAPWIDVTHLDFVVGQVGGTYRVAASFDFPSRPTTLGPEQGTREEAAARTVRFDRDVDIPVGPDNGWVQVVARGSRRMDDVLPFMPVPPMAFTNPVYVVRRPTPPPAFPRVPR
jgi:hypothetical protein